MKYRKYIFIFLVAIVSFFLTSCGESDPAVKFSLRAAHVAYNVKRYALAIEKYDRAINEGWTDGIDLYQYAYSLEQVGRVEESRIYYQKAYVELQKFHPNHAFIQLLEAKGYAEGTTN